MGQMAAALAHELNQPLTAVTSYLGACRRLLAQGGNDAGGDAARRAKMHDVMNLAGAQARRAAEIIRHVRQFVGSGQTERTVENAARVIRDASTLAITAARHKGVQVRSDFSAAGEVVVSKVQIQQVIVNLVRNAVEAMDASPRKELDISISATHEFIEVAVSDTGPGLSPEIVNRLFKPFSSTKQKGMGIGLSVCREIVEAHHGKIWVEANPGGGTVFRFTLPLARDELIA
jgi:C4-dicarboxylate-specific signal transduction histidine kinase